MKAASKVRNLAKITQSSGSGAADQLKIVMD
jgi:hypothetical protein